MSTIITTTTEIRTTSTPTPEIRTNTTSTPVPFALSLTPAATPPSPGPVINFSRLVRRSTDDAASPLDADSGSDPLLETDDYFHVLPSNDDKVLPDSPVLPDEPQFSSTPPPPRRSNSGARSPYSCSCKDSGRPSPARSLSHEIPRAVMPMREKAKHQQRGLASERAPPARHPPPELPLPDEPRFSVDSTPPHPEDAEEVWSSRRAHVAPLRFAQQRHMKDHRASSRSPNQSRPPPPRPTTTTNPTGEAAGAPPPREQKPLPATPPPGAGPRPPAPTRTKTPPTSILKHTTISQRRDPAPPPRPASRPRASEDGTRGTSSSSLRSGTSYDSSSRATAAKHSFVVSDYDTSELSAKEIKKLEKKGINPALYLEMKAARKGKGFIGPLVGNTYVS